MANVKSHAFDIAVKAGKDLYASRRLNQMSNDDAMKALALEILTAYLGALPTAVTGQMEIEPAGVGVEKALPQTNLRGGTE